MNEFGDDPELSQLLFPGLGPDVMRWDISGPVDPVPRPSFGSIFQKVFHCAQRKVTLTVGSPVPSLSPPPAMGVQVFPTTQRISTVCRAAGFILLSEKRYFFKTKISTKQCHQNDVSYHNVKHSQRQFTGFLYYNSNH